MLNETTNERIARYAKHAKGIERIDLSFLPLEDQLDVLSKITEPGKRYLPQREPDQELFREDGDRFFGHTLKEDGSEVYSLRFGYEILLKSLDLVSKSSSLSDKIKKYEGDSRKKLSILRDLLLVEDNEFWRRGVSISSIDSILGDVLNVSRAKEVLNRYAVTNRERRIQGCTTIVRENLEGNLSEIADEGIDLMMEGFDDKSITFWEQKIELAVKFGKNCLDLYESVSKGKRKEAINCIHSSIEELISQTESEPPDWKREYLFSNTKTFLEFVVGLEKASTESGDSEILDTTNQYLGNIKTRLLNFPRSRPLNLPPKFNLGLVEILESSKERFTEEELYGCGEDYLVRGDYKTANAFFEKCGRKPNEAKIKEIVSQRLKKFQEKKYSFEEKRDPHISEINEFLDDIERIPDILPSSIEEAKAVAKKYFSDKLKKAEEITDEANQQQGFNVQRGYESVLPVYLLAKRLGIATKLGVQDAAFEYLYFKANGGDSSDHKLTKEEKRNYFTFMREIYPDIATFLEKLSGV